jgi:hypothetical protein
MESNSMTGEQSLDIIRKMINSAKQELEDDSFYYLLWGWLVFISCLAHFIMIRMMSPYQGLSWAVLMPLGAVISVVYGRKQNKNSRIKTYIDEMMQFVIIAFVVSLFIVLGFQSKLGLNTYPMVMLVYGIWLFISGGALKFIPLIAGGIINWVIAIASFFVPFEYQLLLLALAVLSGYIIPGHLLKNKFKKQKNHMQNA